MLHLHRAALKRRHTDFIKLLEYASKKGVGWGSHPSQHDGVSMHPPKKGGDLNHLEAKLWEKDWDVRDAAAASSSTLSREDAAVIILSLCRSCEWVKSDDKNNNNKNKKKQ